MCDHVRIKNETGADIDQYQFAIVGPYAAVADEDIADDAVGSFHVEEGIQIQTDELHATEHVRHREPGLLGTRQPRPSVIR